VRTAMTTAMAAWTTGAARTHTRAEGSWHRHHRHTAGTHPWWEWSTREDEHPFGAFGTARTVHAVMMTERLIMSADEGAGEEDNGHDENGAGDDYHPGRSLVEP
jgi:hypothetical protein